MGHKQPRIWIRQGTIDGAEAVKDMDQAGDHRWSRSSQGYGSGKGPQMEKKQSRIWIKKATA